VDLNWEASTSEESTSNYFNVFSVRMISLEILVSCLFWRTKRVTFHYNIQNERYLGFEHNRLILPGQCGLEWLSYALTFLLWRKRFCALLNATFPASNSAIVGVAIKHKLRHLYHTTDKAAALTGRHVLSLPANCGSCIFVESNNCIVQISSGVQLTPRWHQFGNSQNSLALILKTLTQAVYVRTALCL